MATLEISGLKRQNTHAHTYGILNRRFIKWATSAFVSGDHIKLWRIPAGAEVHEVTMVVAAAESAGTIDVGFINDDGTNDTDFFIDGVSMASAVGTTTRSITDTQHEPLKVTEPNVFLAATPQAVVNDSLELHFHVTYTYEGNL